MRRLFVKAFEFELVLSALLFLSGCNQGPYESEEKGVQTYFCGGENLSQTGNDLFYDDGQGQFTHGGYQETDSVFDGKFSVRLDSIRQYGMSIRLTDVLPGEYFETSIWIKNPVGRATLIVGATGKTNYTLNASQINKREERNGWTNYFMSFGIESKVDTLTIFPFSAGESHYFDNLEIKRFAQRPPLEDSLHDVALKLYIPDSAMNLLTQYKFLAMEQDMISSDLKEYVTGAILEGSDSIPVEIRLKGDWTDHLEGGKTSYRIKTDLAYKGLTTFSIQHPQTRNYMHEWFMHRLCEEEGLLATSYDFLPVEINGVNQGIYAIEEHFDKQLLESRNRREGPIIKMDESGFWALLASGKKDELNGSYPYFESSMITCFKEGRTEKSEVLSGQFENASTLLWLYKNLYASPELIFDLEKTAKYYALMDLGNIHHSLAWHNRRYYYNPVTTKLEIIGFDMAPAIYPFNDLLALRKFKTSNAPQEDENAIDHFLFLNSEFREFYTYYVNLYSSENYLDSMFMLLEPEIEEREKLLSVEFPNYHLDRTFYYAKAANMRDDLKNLQPAWDDFVNENPNNSQPEILAPNYPALTSDFLLEEVSINAYRTQLDSTHFRLQLENFHLADAAVVGYSTKDGEDSVFMFDQQVPLKRYDGIKEPDYSEIILDRKPNKIHFTVANIPGVLHSKKIFSWKKPELIHPRIELEKSFKLNSASYKIQADTLYFKKGQTTISEIIFVPSDYKVVFEAGTQIDIKNEGAIILNNSTYFRGTEENPVLINSSDSSSMGVTILTPDEVEIRHTKLFNQGTLGYKGWQLTGALTIYEGDVLIDKLEIAGNACEDGLNIIRGNFQITNLFIHDTKGDAFDADFCTGKISKSTFFDTGNDCIDFSGTVVEISEITIRNSGDKGISSGEKSTLTVKNIDINGALTALASKDGSVLTATGITAINCEVGVALYRKKPEYPFSKMTVGNSSFSDIKTLALIERGAVLNYNKADYFGYATFDIEAMYARFEK